MSKVYLVLQDNDDSRYIVEAITEDNRNATVEYQPAMVRIEAMNSLIINKETVEEKIGRDWDVQELHLNLVTLGGNVDEDEESFSISWNS